MIPNRSFNYFFGGAGVPPMSQLPPGLQAQLQPIGDAMRSRFQGLGDAIRTGYQQQTGQPFPFQPGQSPWGGPSQPMPGGGQPQGLPFGMGTGQTPGWASGLQGLMSRFMPPR